MRFKVLSVAVSSLSLMGVVTAPSAQAAVREYRNVSTGFCLDSNARGQVYTLGCNGGNYQRWDVRGTDASTVLRNVSTGFCLDSNAARRVYTMRCNGGSYQKWRVQRNSSGAVRFHNVATGFCLDSNAARQVYTHPCNGGNYQRWVR